MNGDMHRRNANDQAVRAHDQSHKALMKLLIPFVKVEDHNFIYEDFLEAVAVRLLEKIREVRAARQQASFDNDPRPGMYNNMAQNEAKLRLIATIDAEKAAA